MSTDFNPTNQSSDPSCLETFIDSGSVWTKGPTVLTAASTGVGREERGDVWPRTKGTRREVACLAPPFLSSPALPSRILRMVDQSAVDLQPHQSII
ncbi:hypothetical protein CDAR_365381 [Caerostris darwini]|uniref:Uncharacterized protein n=1 Tax=Caerostris darwini TaxID=1538125 RepID=A0AAV4QFE2_9ARAC|nr:hypothetical protein CDAR_365381 [Caerostris darwini]